MTPMLKSDEADSIDSKIRNLRASISEAENQLMYCHRMLAEDEQMLASLKIELKTEKNSEYLKAASSAFRASIKAWKASIVAFEGDVDAYQIEIRKLLN
jgi:hypothetical protein